MMKKRGAFFSLDVLIAIIILLLAVLIIFPILKYRQEETFIQRDVLGVLENLKVGEINNNYVQNQLIPFGYIRDPNKSLLYQLGEFYITNDTIARNLGREILLYLNTTQNIGIWFNDNPIATKNNLTSYDPSLSRNIKVESRIISGLVEGLNDTTGYSARAFFQSDIQTRYFYFGGYVGEGNLSVLVEYDGTLQDVELEMAINEDFGVFINGSDLGGYFQNSSSEFEPVHHSLNSYLDNFSNGTNLVTFVSRSVRPAHIAGGFVKITYKTNQTFERKKRYYFPGVEGLINVYDGFYIPGTLNSLNLSLHIDSNYSTFMTIGNKTIFKNLSTAGVETMFFDNANLSAKLNYSDIFNKTIPLRLGLENATYLGQEVMIDSILVTDVSGSMEWCTKEGETGTGDAVWGDGRDVFCGTRRYLTKNCFPQKISAAETAEKAFVNEMLKETGPKIGIVEYTSGNTVKKVREDLTTKLYVGTDPDCYEPDWVEEDYDDSSWDDYSPFLYPYHIDNCDRCRGFFRKKFNMTNVSDVKYVKLTLYGDDGNLCFINNKEIGHQGSYRRWSYYDVPKTILREGENLLACSVHEYTGNFRFLPKLYSDKGNLIPEKTPASVYPNDPSMVLHYTFDDYNDPVKDFSGFGNDGTVIGSALWEVNGSMSFEGNSYIRVPNSPSLQINGDLTIEFWINPNGYSGYRWQSLIDKRYNREFSLLFGDSGEKGGIRFYQGGSSYNYWHVFDPGTIKDYEWQHVVITRDASTRTIKSYYNGVLNKTFTYASVYDPLTTTYDVYIADGNWYGFRGRMDEVAIYNRVLNPGEIQSHYNSAGSSDGKWKKKTYFQCGSTYDPKYTRVRRNVDTNYTILATIKNSGEEITSPFNISFYKDSVAPFNEIGKVRVNGIKAWSLRNITIYYNQSLSAYSKIIADVDSDNDITTEQNEGNNRAEIGIYVYDFIGKDLIIESVFSSPSFCSWSPRTYTINARVRNIGGVDVVNKFNVTLFNGSVSPANKIGYFEVNGLTMGSTYTGSVTWWADLNADTLIIAYADYENVIGEAVETNNQRAGSIYDSLPDLWIHKILINESICAPGPVERNFTVSAYAYYCPTTNYSDVSFSLTPNDYSNWQPVPPIPGTGSRNFRKYFSIPLTAPNIGTRLYVYSYVDMNSTNVSESNEGNNAGSAYFNIGPNLYFSQAFAVNPSTVIKNTVTNIDLSAKIRNVQCGPASFKFGFYNGSFDYNNPTRNLLYTEDITLIGTSERTVSYTWTTSLDSDTTVYAVIDYERSVSEYDENNIQSRVITAQETSSMSVFPFLTNLKYDPILLEVLGLTSSCVGNTYQLFQPDENIARTINLTDNRTELYDFIDETDTWWGTCICCGINKGVDLLKDSTTINKFMVVMSDGVANVECAQQGLTPDLNGNGQADDAGDDAIQAACDAFNNKGITVYAVGFGEDVDNDTLQGIANCGNGSYYYGNVSELVGIYQNISRDIINTSYKRQTIIGKGNIRTKLFSDSYIEFDYVEEAVPYGLVLTAEKPFYNNLYGNFSVPSDALILETNVISYSGPRWTERVDINTNNTYNLSEYGNQFIKLGDPYSISIPNYLVETGGTDNQVLLKTGLSPTNVTGGSINNSIIYKILRKMIAYSEIMPFVQGCNWTIEFEDGDIITMKIPQNPSRNNQCSYTGTSISMSEPNDALSSAVKNLLELLDFNNNGKVDVKFTEQNFVIGTSRITGIPYSPWAEVQVRVWESD
jgi:hypothetical protein